MGAQRLKKPKKEIVASPPKEEPETKKKRRWKPGGVRTRQRIRKAQKQERVIPKAALRRLVLKTMNKEGIMKRWTPNALEALSQLIDTRSHRVLTLASTLAGCSKKATLNSTHVKLAKTIESEYAQ